MSKSQRVSWLFVPAGLMCVAVGAFGQPTASMNLNSPGSNVVDGIYVGPYYAYINGVETPVICDDFADESYIPETWTADVTSFSGLSSTAGLKFSSASLVQYEEAAYLAQELMTASPSAAGALQYAIWDVFEQGAVTSYLDTYYPSNESSLQGAALSLVGEAQLAVSSPSFSESDLADVSIYTPTSAAPMCGQGPCPSSPPQEFMTVSVSSPEPAQFAILGIDLLGVGAIVVFFRRRRANG